MEILRVYPNPWAAFDASGVPCAICPRDPDADAGGPGMFVGARVDKKNTRVLDDFVAAYKVKFGAALAAKLADQEHRSPRQATFYEYLGVPSQDPELAEKLAGKEPVEIPATKYYKDRLREGSLLPADAATAARVGVPFAAPGDYFAARSLKPVAVPVGKAIAPADPAPALATEPKPSLEAAPADAESLATSKKNRDFSK